MVKTSAPDDGFAEFVREQLSPLGRITTRRMFGKAGVFCDGVMLGMITENTLYFHHGAWRSRPWTYPDYQRADYHQFFGLCRDYLRRKYA